MEKNGLYENLEERLEGVTYTAISDIEKQIDFVYETIKEGGSDKEYLYDLLELREEMLKKLGEGVEVPFEMGVG